MPNPQTVSLTLVERIDWLERQNRRFKLAAAVGLTVVTSLLIMGQAPSRKTQSVAPAGDDKYAPLPDEIVKAKTVFYINDTGNSRFGDDLYKELKKWNRWEIVTDRTRADLILVLSQRDSVVGVISTGSTTAARTGTYATSSATGIVAPIKASSWHIYIVDPTTGETLWIVSHTLGARLWQSWGSVARSLLSDIQKRMK
ncbi:MAG TPA: hypothetical protein VHM88_14135 [Candidatus Acidoferrales bacterium]|jgi:hypothetical protein|nr:hypothetical protein [Candidatus Acidoferrales bacterium]